VSGGKRRPIDLGALQAVALPQPDPVEEVSGRAKAPAAPKPDRPAPPAKPKTAPEPKAGKGAKSQQASRQGKVGIQFWTEPETRKQLKRFAMEYDRTLDDIMREAVADFMTKNKIA